MRDLIARLLRDVGLRVATEEHVPAWDRRRRDGTWERARLDLRIEGGPDGGLRYADVAVTHPVSSVRRIVAANAAVDGRAAAAEERVKWNRYGTEVLPLAVESYGRWGPCAQQWLRELAWEVAVNDPALAHHGSFAGGVLLGRWWTLLSVRLQLGNVQALKDAFALPAPRFRPAAPAAPAPWELLVAGTQPL